MQSPYKLIVIGFIVVLVGFSAVVALHTAGEPRSADDQAQQRRATQVDRPVTADVVQRASPQIGAPGSSVASDTTDTVKADVQDVSILAKAKPKGPLAPEHLAAHRAEELILARRDYGTLFEMLKLSPQQEEDFLEVIVADAVAEPANVAEWRANRAKRRRDQIDKLSAIVGYDKVPIFESYLHNIAEHTRVTQVAMQLDAAGSPLNKEQKTYLAQLMIAERERVPQPSAQKPIMTTADIDRELEWVEDQDRRVREGAASMLSPTQLKYLDEFLAARLARRRVEFYRIPVTN